MMRSIFRPAGVAAIFAIATGFSASAQHTDDRTRDMLDLSRAPAAQCRTGQSSVRVNQRINGQGRIQVKNLLNLGQCQGYAVRSVILTARSDRARQSQASLLVNGNYEGYAQAIQQNGRQLIFNLGRNNELGRDIQTLQIFVQGNVIVDQVGVVLDSYRPGPQPGPGPRPGPGPGPRPGPGPGYPQPGYQPVWSTAAGGGYYDTTGRIQGNMRLAQMRQFGGRFASGEPVPMYQVIVNSVGHVCAQPGYNPPTFASCAGLPTHYE